MRPGVCLSGGTREEVETQTLSREIIELLGAAVESKTEPEITEGKGGKTKFVRRALRQLVSRARCPAKAAEAR
jgi:hypothetical protein